jgi:hypothetical protein
MGKIIITIILVNIEIAIIQTIIFEFENMINYSACLSKKTICNWELWNLDKKNPIQNNVKICN